MEKNWKAPKEKTEMWNFYELLVAPQLPYQKRPCTRPSRVHLVRRSVHLESARCVDGHKGCWAGQSQPRQSGKIPSLKFQIQDLTISRSWQFPRFDNFKFKISTSLRPAFAFARASWSCKRTRRIASRSWRHWLDVLSGNKNGCLPKLFLTSKHLVFVFKLYSYVLL